MFDVAVMERLHIRILLSKLLDDAVMLLRVTAETVLATCASFYPNSTLIYFQNCLS